MPEYQPLDYRLRCHTKRTDLPPDVLRDIGEAYDLLQGGRQVNMGMEYEDILMRNQELMAIINRLTAERDDARREVCEWCAGCTKESPESVAMKNGWDCFKEDGK